MYDENEPAEKVVKKEPAFGETVSMDSAVKIWVNLYTGETDEELSENDSEY